MNRHVCISINVCLYVTINLKLALFIHVAAILMNNRQPSSATLNICQNTLLLEFYFLFCHSNSCAARIPETAQSIEHSQQSLWSSCICLDTGQDWRLGLIHDGAGAHISKHKSCGSAHQVLHKMRLLTCALKRK